MAEITLNYVNSYRDIRNGKMRHVFRRRGYKKLLKGRPGSAEFMDHYAALLASSEDVRPSLALEFYRSTWTETTTGLWSD